MRSFLYPAWGLLALMLAGCSVPDKVRTEYLVPPALTSHASSADESPLYRSISVGSVVGIERKSVVRPEVGSAEFKEALNLSLSKSDYLGPSPADAKYTLDVFIIDIDLRDAGPTFTVDAFVRYKLTAKSGEIVFQQIIRSEAPGNTDEMAAGGRAYQERVVRNSISDLLERLRALSLSLRP